MNDQRAPRRTACVPNAMYCVGFVPGGELDTAITYPAVRGQYRQLQSCQDRTKVFGAVASPRDSTSKCGCKQRPLSEGACDPSGTLIYTPRRHLTEEQANVKCHRNISTRRVSQAVWNIHASSSPGIGRPTYLGTVLCVLFRAVAPLGRRREQTQYGEASTSSSHDIDQMTLGV